MVLKIKRTNNHLHLHMYLLFFSVRCWFLDVLSMLIIAMIL